MMALRLCNSIIRKSLCFPGNARLPFPLETASPFFEGGAVRRPRASGQIVLRFASAAFIASEAVWKRLVKGKATETHDSPCHYPAAVPPNNDDHMSLLFNDPDHPENSKILKVAIIGDPNAGKSTLSNHIMGRKVFAVSKKVHTTRTRAQGVLIENNTQIVILDTPGLITPSKVKRHQLERSLLVDPWSSVQEADLVLVVVDISDKWARRKLGFEVLKCLAQNPDIPAVLVLNKVDLLKDKTKLLDVTVRLTEGMVNGKTLKTRSVGKLTLERECAEPGGEPKGTELKGEVVGTEPNWALEGVELGALASTDRTTSAGSSIGQKQGLNKEELRMLRMRQGWPHFQDVFMLSAVNPEDVEALRTYLLVAAKPGSWQYHSSVLTDQSPEEICVNAVRERLLEYLPQEVPYNVSQTIQMWHENESGELDIIMKLRVKKENHLKMLIGQGGHMIARIAQEAGEDLMNAFRRVVKLKLSVKMEKGGRA